MPTKSSTETSRVTTFYWVWMDKSNSVSMHTYMAGQSVMEDKREWGREGGARRGGGRGGGGGEQGGEVGGGGGEQGGGSKEGREWGGGGGGGAITGFTG